jgi:hypothetical protein
VALTDDLVFCLEMDDAAAHATADDAHSAGPYHFTANGATAAGSTAGKIGTARTLNNSDQDFSRAHNAAYSCASGADWCLSAWLYWDGEAGFLAVKQDASHGEMQLRTTGASTVQLSIFGSSGFGGQVNCTTTDTVNSNAWNHVYAAFEDGVGLAVRINGGTAATQAHVGAIYSATGAAFVIGSQRPYGDFIGSAMDQTAFWRGRVLDTTDFNSLYNAGAGLAYSSWGGGGGATPLSPPVFQKRMRIFKRGF